VTNNGGFNWRRDELGHPVILPGTPPGYEGGRLERVDLATGKFERLYSRCGELALRGPNDLVFDRTGGIWFTDLGKRTERVRDLSVLYYARPDGSHIEAVHFGGLSFNGVGLSPDERTVYVADTLSARLWAYDTPEPGKVRAKGSGISPAAVVGSLPGEQMLDSLAVTEAGNVCVGTLLNGCVTTFTPNIGFEQFAMPDKHVTNICFGGPDRRDAFITMSGTGRVAKVRWQEPGLALNFATY
jgi:gluconolactonase